ncbi:hypothetical protein GCM10028809_03470 [Spirosoma gilvum]
MLPEPVIGVVVFSDSLGSLDKGVDAVGLEALTQEMACKFSVDQQANEPDERFGLSKFSAI